MRRRISSSSASGSLETKRANRGLVSSLLGASFGNSGWCHADLLLEHMKPDARLPIYQTKVSTIPSYQFVFYMPLTSTE